MTTRTIRYGDIRYGDCAGCSKRFRYTYNGGHSRKWCSERCRKRSYDRECSECGTRISGTDPGKSLGRCAKCANANRSRMAREIHIAAIREWAAIYGAPPAINDWNPYAAARLKDSARAERALRGGWPHSMGIIHVWGSWNAAISAAGLSPRPSGNVPGAYRDSASLRELRVP